MKTKNKALIVISISALLIVSVFFIQSANTPKAQPVTLIANQTFDKLPPGLAPAVARTFQENLPESYHIKKSWKTYRADNESHEMRYAFTSNGPLIQSSDRSWKWSMSLKKWGYGNGLQPVPSSKITTSQEKIEYNRGQTLTEWYKNTIFGLEQGFTLKDRPAVPREKDSELSLEIAISGTLTPMLEGNTLYLQNKRGDTVSRYTGLYAYDANHQKLPAWLTLADNTISIVVDDSQAVYPVTIDPWLQRAKLTANDGDSYDEFGRSVSTYTISNKDYVVIGAHKAWGLLYNTGVAYVFEKPDNGWSSTNTPATKLMQSDPNEGSPNGGDAFGFSVDIYHDYIVVGAYGHDTDAGETNAGAAYVFERPGTSWSDAGETMTETVKFTANSGDRDEGDGFGYSVAAASDVFVVGAYHDDHESSSEENWGAAYVFTKSKTTSWTTGSLKTKLVQSNPTANGDYWNEFGTSVDVASFSSSPDVIVVGTPQENNRQGAAYVFVGPVEGWAGETTTETARLSSSNCDGNDYFGTSVAIDANTVVVGARSDDGYCNGPLVNNIGAAFVYQKPISGWADMTDETARLSAGDCANSQYFGVSVAIDGDTIVVGARGDNSYTGAAYIFKRPESGTWTDMTHTFKLTARDGATNDYFGCSVAINGDTAIVGAFDNENKGAAYIFEPGSAGMPWMIPLLME